MSFNLQKAIDFMYGLKSRGVTYSMLGKRNGSDGTADCSGAIYTALLQAGLSDAGWILNTDSMHKWLRNNGYKKIATNQEWPMQKHDVIIFGPEGASRGAAGHVVYALDGTNVIHCNYGANGVSVNNENQMPYDMGWTVYRFPGAGNPNPTTKPSNGAVIDDVIRGKYGSGLERRKNLKAAGYDPDKVQKDVNERLLGGVPDKQVDKIAREVLQGKWGNGDERTKRLKAAGHDPVKVQTIVNQLV
jgi:hypothetical protein